MYFEDKEDLFRTALYERDGLEDRERFDRSVLQDSKRTGKQQRLRFRKRFQSVRARLQNG